VTGREGGRGTLRNVKIIHFKKKIEKNMLVTNASTTVSVLKLVAQSEKGISRKLHFLQRSNRD